jgi:hypothetical protein
LISHIFVEVDPVCALHNSPVPRIGSDVIIGGVLSITLKQYRYGTIVFCENGKYFVR